MATSLIILLAIALACAVTLWRNERQRNAEFQAIIAERNHLFPPFDDEAEYDFADCVDDTPEAPIVVEPGK